MTVSATLTIGRLGAVVVALIVALAAFAALAVSGAKAQSAAEFYAGKIDRSGDRLQRRRRL